jgi:23S rRNA pseudouridine1911/1915/1917 synthase
LIEAGRVHIGGRTRPKRHVVRAGEVVEVAARPPASRAAGGAGVEAGFAVAYEDDYLIVVDKPAGLVVHPAPGNEHGTLVNGLLARFPELRDESGDLRPGIVHRLDKDTSGLLVAAKTERAMASLAKQFANHTIERAYHAVVWGAPREASGRIESQIGRNPFDRKRMAVLRGGGKAARTRYAVAEKFGPAERPFAALVECRLETGRTHQIRVHLTHLGHPLIGDMQYGRKHAAPRPKTEAEARAFTAAADFPRQALHAFVLGFQHPSLHKTLRFEAPWPADFAELVAALRGLNSP